MVVQQQAGPTPKPPGAMLWIPATWWRSSRDSRTVEPVVHQRQETLAVRASVKTAKVAASGESVTRVAIFPVSPHFAPTTGISPQCRHRRLCASSTL